MNRRELKDAITLKTFEFEGAMAAGRTHNQLMKIYKELKVLKYRLGWKMDRDAIEATRHCIDQMHIQQLTKKKAVNDCISGKRELSSPRFFIGYWILHEAGFLSSLFYFNCVNHFVVLRSTK